MTYSDYWVVDDGATGLSITCHVKDLSGATVSSQTAVTLTELGNGFYGTTLQLDPKGGRLEFSGTTDSVLYTGYGSKVYENATATGEYVIDSGTNSATLYDDDGNALQVFDLFDKFGNPASQEVYERRRV